MAAFRDDMPLVAGVNEDWDENTTRAQIVRPDWDFSPIRMETMHHLPHIFFDTLRPERPDCQILIPSSFSASRDRVISQDIYSYEPCGLPTGNFMPAESAQIRLMTASPITLHTCIPAPDQVTPEQAYFKDLDFYKKTLFHTPFLSRGRAVTLLEYRNAKVVFEVDDWFSMLPQAVKRYLLPLQSKYAKWYKENVRHLTQNYSYCTLYKQKESNLQRHYMQHHARWRAIWFCPIPMHSTPHPEPTTLSARPRPASQLPRPRASSVPPTPNPAKRKAVRYQLVTEDLTPPVMPPRAYAVEQNVVLDTPSPVQRPGRSRGRGTWRAPQKIAPGVETRSKSRQAELEQIEAKQALAARAEWPTSPDTTQDIQRMTRELRLCDMPKELQQIMPDLPDLDDNQNQNLPKPPAAGLMTQHQDVFFIPPLALLVARGGSRPQ